MHHISVDCNRCLTERKRNNEQLKHEIELLFGPVLDDVCGSGQGGSLVVAAFYFSGPSFRLSMEDDPGQNTTPG